MATDKQNEANRLNAQKSTGPRTAEGKARSCLNHVTTGIDAQSAIIPSEDSADLQALADRYFTQFQPATEDERYQVDILVRCDWQSRRLMRGEAQLWKMSMAGPIRRNEPNQMAEGYNLRPKTFAHLDRRVEINERAYNRARHELERLQSARRIADEASEPAAPPEELGSNAETTPEAATPDPPTPKFGPEPASDPLGTPEQAPPKSA